MKHQLNGDRLAKPRCSMVMPSPSARVAKGLLSPVHAPFEIAPVEQFVITGKAGLRRRNMRANC